MIVRAYTSSNKENCVYLVCNGMYYPVGREMFQDNEESCMKTASYFGYAGDSVIHSDHVCEIVMTRPYILEMEF